MAMSLRDHSDTWVNVTTFIHPSNAHLKGPRGSQSVRLVASQDTPAGKACAPQGPHQAIGSFGLRLLGA
jgi:hypothetical protein